MNNPDAKFKDHCIRCNIFIPQSGDLYVCQLCRKKEERLKELIDKYGMTGKPLSRRNIAKMFFDIISTHRVNVKFIFEVFDQMDKMDEWEETDGKTW